MNIGPEEVKKIGKLFKEPDKVQVVVGAWSGNRSVVHVFAEGDIPELHDEWNLYPAMQEIAWILGFNNMEEPHYYSAPWRTPPSEYGWRFVAWETPDENKITNIPKSAKIVAGMVKPKTQMTPIGSYSEDFPEERALFHQVAMVKNLKAHNGGVWGNHPDYPVEDWQYEVANDDTRLGYWEWVHHQDEMNRELGE